MAQEPLVIVIGDVMLDRYVVGQYKRNSPEAPVPILNYESHNALPGGAANVALNLKGLNINCHLISVTGKDPESDTLKKLMTAEKIECTFIKESARRTTVKTRYVDRQYKQYLRLDEEDRHYISAETENTILTQLEEMTGFHDIRAVIIQDYNKGVISERLIKGLYKLANKYNITVFSDPKKNNFALLAQSHYFKPNLKECRDFLNVGDKMEEDEIISKLCSSIPNSSNLVVTLGKEGIFYRNQENTGKIMGHNVDDPDVSGAGDTVIAVLCAMWMENKSLEEMCQLANHAGAVVCGKKGIASIYRTDLM